MPLYQSISWSVSQFVGDTFAFLAFLRHHQLHGTTTAVYPAMFPMNPFNPSSIAGSLVILAFIQVDRLVHLSVRRSICVSFYVSGRDFPCPLNH